MSVSPTYLSASEKEFQREERRKEGGGAIKRASVIEDDDHPDNYQAIFMSLFCSLNLSGHNHVLEGTNIRAFSLGAL